MGLEGALRFRILSRRAVFLEVFSMVGDFAAGTAAVAGLPADLAGVSGLAAGLGSGLRAGFGAGLAPTEVFRLLAGFLWFEAMGFGGG